MASSSLSRQQNAFTGIETSKKRREVEESSRLFDVFINHRGPDVKQTLATQLYNSLKELDIRAFLDSQEKELGDSFPSTIEIAIRSASVHIAIFSKKYAESAWCLAELDLMLQSKAKIIPVFYQVEPWELRRIEKGVYAEAFLKYQEKGRYMEKLQDWKEALQSVSFTAGYEFNNPDDCKHIVSAVKKEVERTKLLHVAKYPVGLHKLVEDFERRCLDELVQDFESQCGMRKAAKDKANVVGIFGMGGVGKTTLSKELFNRKRSKYTRASFLFDVREACASGKLPLLQSKLLKDLFSEDHYSFQSSEEGTSYLRDRLERSNSFNFLIVLDDIDHVEQLDALLDMDILNKSAQSVNYLVIITTRDVGVLVSARIDKGYHLKGLDGEDGRELFCWHAFGRPQPCSGFEDLVQAFVNLCGGLPLSLQVLGRHVSGRARWYWLEELKKVSKTLPGDIKKRLKISFDTLDDVEKQIFLDIACFFIDKTISKAMSIWETSGWSAYHALETLKEKCLVEVQVEVSSSEWSVFRMHDHLRDMGREIANEQSHARRVWQPQHLKSLELKGFQCILAQTKGRCFHSILDKSMGCGITYFLGEPEDGSDTYLQWLQLEYMSCPALDLNSDINSSIPSWISLQNLRCLRISNGRFQKLWQSDVQAPSHLKELQIHDTYLEEFPYLSGKLNQMEKLVLHAKDMQMDIWHLLGCLPRMNLRSLNVMGSEITGDLASNDTAEGTTFMPFVISDCKQLWEGEVALNNEAWSRTVMGDVENLEINGQRLVTKILITGNCCQRLQSLKICELENLIEADLARIKTLNCLEITGCEKFKRLSATPDLSKLVELKIKGCTELEELPSLSRLSCLERIEIDSCEKLKYLCLSRMKCLERITFNRNVRVKYFELDGCANLKTIKFSCEELVELSIRGCPKLKKLPVFRGLSCLERILIDGCEKLDRLSLDGCQNLKNVSGNLFRQLYIIKCPELEKLHLARLSCLEEIAIDSCEKLQNIMVPTTLLSLSVRCCRDLQSLAGTGDLTKLRRLIIEECPKLEELPSLAKLSCLEEIAIDSCEKLQNIMVPTTLLSLSVRCCRDLQSLAGTGDLTKLRRLIFTQCPKFEELPSLSTLSCLEQIEIYSCEKLKFEYLCLSRMKCLERITFDRNVKVKYFELDGCPNLKKIRFSCEELVELSIRGCPELKELPVFRGLSCLERILIDGCEKLDRLSLDGCQNLKNVSGNLFRQLYITQCPELEKLHLARLSGLEEIWIDSCEKLQNIMVPTTLLRLPVRCCRDLQSVAGTGDLTKLRRLIIRQCPKLEELPSLSTLSCLERIEIYSCEKLQNIMVPTTLLRLSVRCCRDLQSVAGTGDLTKLRQLIIRQCPKLEELPSLAKLSFLEEFWIDSCEKLQNIMVPTTLLRLSVRYCRDLQSVAGTGDLTKLIRLIIRQCPNLEELPSLAKLSCLEEIWIDSCEKLQNIMVPTTLLRLSVRCCRDLQSVAGTGDLTKLRRLIIRQCPKLEELPSLPTLSCLERIEIYSCEKLKFEYLCLSRMKCLERITFDRNVKVKYFELDGCPNLKKIRFSCEELVELSIRGCPELKELPVFRGLSCLERILIDGCEKLDRLSLDGCQNLKNVSGNLFRQLYITQCPELEKLHLARLSGLEEIWIDSCEKLQNIMVPTTLVRLSVRCCRDLQSVAGTGDLTKLRRLIIRQCPKLEELPSLSTLSCLERIEIYSCEKLQMPTTLPSQSLRCCRDLAGTGDLTNIRLAKLRCLEKIRIDSCKKLQNIMVRRSLPGVAGIGDFTNLTRLIIKQCPELEVLTSLARLSCLEEITIDSCEKLQNITLPTTLLSLSVRRCRNLQSVGGTGDLTKLRLLNIKQCPRLEELSTLVRLSWMEKLQNISELRQSEYMKLCYCRNAVIRNCIDTLKSMPSEYIFLTGRAADGAELTLNEHLFSEAEIGVTEISPLFSEGFQMWSSELSFVIGCFVVMVDRSSLVEEISKTLPRYHDGYVVSLPRYVCPGKWIITMVACDDRSYHWYYKNGEDVLRRHGIMKGFRIEVKKGEEGKKVGVLRTIVDRLHCSCWEFVHVGSLFLM